ncbi:MAG: GAF domain-containing protein [Bacteroidales bacterium]|nr:GAF domain-containing protein [Bacteroidales bacterium]
MQIFSGIAYVFFAIVATFLLLKFVSTADKNRPKEEVKIIYKNFDKEKADKELIEKKTKDKAEKIADSFIKDLPVIEDKEKFTELILNKLAKTFHLVQGVFYLWNEQKQVFNTANTYAFYSTEQAKDFAIGEGINGQVAKNKKFLLIDNVPDDYVNVVSGLGEGTPNFLAFMPIIYNEKTIGIIEFASFIELPQPTEKIFNTLAQHLSPIIQKFV